MKLAKLDTDVIAEAVGGQIEAQGMGCVRVDDGHVFFFTVAKLEELIAKAYENDGLAMIAVKRDSEA